MEYASQKPKLIIPEYGRHIQMLVEQAIDIEDRKERNNFASAIIDLMGEMYPYLRDVNDFKHKLWTHLSLMSDFKLDIDSPYGKPDRAEIYKRPPKLPYPQKRMKFRYYGRTIIKLITLAVDMEESEEKTALIYSIATHMKKQYLSWNKEIVENKTIFRDLEILSEGKIILPENYSLPASRDLVKQNHSKQNHSKQNHDKKRSHKRHKRKSKH